VIVVDTSAWVDLFRGRRTPAASVLERLIEEHADIAITETILMEVLAGARSGESLAHVRARLVGRPILRLEGLADFEEAAHIYRTCRAAGETLRSQLDCLIAVPTIRHGASLLHNDRDFETIARHTSLKLEPVLRSASADDETEIRETGAAYARRHPRRKVTSGRSPATRPGTAGPGKRGPSRTRGR